MENLYCNNLFHRKFDMNYDHSKYTIWKIYHNEDQILNYNLFENETIYLFNTSNSGYEGKNINQLNHIICEGCGVLYPYFNNLKSELIGFQHYRRHFKINKIKYNEIISKNIVQVFIDRITIPNEDYNILKKNNIKNNIYVDAFNHFNFWRIVDNGFYDDFIDYLYKYFPEYFPTLYKINKFHNYSMFVCTWKKYIELCEFLWGYLTYIADKYSFDIYNDLDWAEFINEHFIKFNKDNKIPDRHFGQNNWFTLSYDNPNHFKYCLFRIFSFNIEYLISLFANNTGYIYDKNNSIQF